MQNLRPDWTFQDDITVVDRVILKGRCIVIPDSLQKQVPEKLHINHMGMEKTKLFANKTMYWPGNDSDIEKYI